MTNFGAVAFSDLGNVAHLGPTIKITGATPDPLALRTLMAAFCWQVRRPRTRTPGWSVPLKFPSSWARSASTPCRPGHVQLNRRRHR